MITSILLASSLLAAAPGAPAPTTPDGAFALPWPAPTTARVDKVVRRIDTRDGVAAPEDVQRVSYVMGFRKDAAGAVISFDKVQAEGASEPELAVLSAVMPDIVISDDGKFVGAKIKPAVAALLATTKDPETLQVLQVANTEKAMRFGAQQEWSPLVGYWFGVPGLARGERSVIDVATQLPVVKGAAATTLTRTASAPAPCPDAPALQCRTLRATIEQDGPSQVAAMLKAATARETQRGTSAAEVAKSFEGAFVKSTMEFVVIVDASTMFPRRFTKTMSSHVRMPNKGVMTELKRAETDDRVFTLLPAKP